MWLFGSWQTTGQEREVVPYDEQKCNTVQYSAQASGRAGFLGEGIARDAVRLVNLKTYRNYVIFGSQQSHAKKCTNNKSSNSTSNDNRCFTSKGATAWLATTAWPRVTALKINNTMTSITILTKSNSLAWSNNNTSTSTVTPLKLTTALYRDQVEY